jgi:hypothetical protein
MCLMALAACAPISREGCIAESAHDIGYAAAMDNADRAGRFQRVSKICAKQSRVVDLAEYDKGFDAGTATFCAIDNGYRWGRNGRSYKGVCASTEFRVAYENGLQIYNVEKRQEQIRTRLSEIRDRLSSIADSLKNDNALSEKRRRALVAEEDRLLIERKDLLSEQRSL